MILAVCRPSPGADPAAFRALLGQEAAALRDLAARGTLVQAWTTTAGPGAILLLEADAATAEQLLGELPLARAGLLAVDLQQVQPLQL